MGRAWSEGDKVRHCQDDVEGRQGKARRDKEVLEKKSGRLWRTRYDMIRIRMTR